MAHLKRIEEVTAIVLVPMLMSPSWFRRFIRSVDVYFVVKAGVPCWPSAMHEPLLIGLSLPLLRHQPWEWRRVPFMVDLGRTLSGMHKTDPLRGLDLLFWAARTRAHSMPVDVVRGLLQDPHYHRFLRVARPRC